MISCVNEWLNIRCTHCLLMQKTTFAPQINIYYKDMDEGPADNYYLIT
jgi:hypothetical protein